ncbi:EAL domain-containing protein [Shewanella mangrovisoli]|uniref:EAL domain-containing protein n=1 Tax=Shewanella mangrovisoli TaxID=2864211 RepID=UPI001C6608DB|nr:EAL domain-containing protein [Shewanella mangrovisoli]QYK10530.1 EAL domain-containing protein [Shewanella mangrovisoli]
MPKALLKYLFILNIFLYCAPSISQELVPTSSSIPIKLNTKSFSVPEGLSQSTVTAISEDQDGYVWIGTLNGLNRFDGKEFKKYYSNDNSGLSSSFIQSIIFDGQRLLIGTDNGLNIYNENTDRFEKVKNFNIPVWSLSQSESTIIIGTEKEIIEIDKNAFNIINRTSSKDFDSIKKIIKISNGYILKNHNGTIFLSYKNTTKKLSNNAIDIAKINETSYIFTQNEIYAYNENSKSLEKVINISLDNIAVDKNNITYTNNNKLYHLDLTSLTSNLIGALPKISLQPPHLLYHRKNHIFLASVNQGILLVGTKENTIAHIDNINENVWNVSSDERYLAIATNSDTISIIDTLNKSTGIIKTNIDNITNVSINNRKIYFGGRNGLFSTELENATSVKISNDEVVSISNIKNEKLLYGTNNFELNELDTRSNKIINTLHLSQKLPIFEIKYISSEHYILATQAGLIDIKNGQERLIFSDEIVYSIAHANNITYFGTKSAIYTYNHQTEEIALSIKTKNPVYSISVSSSNDIAASSIKEIIIKTDNTVNFLDTDFGAQDEYNTQSSVAVGNVFFFGGIGGLSQVNIDTLKDNLHNIDIETVISELYVFNEVQKVGNGRLTKAIEKSQKIELKYSDYPFTLKFNSPRSVSKNIDYYYQLDGLSNDWIADKGNNSATYTNLSPGKYTFNVYGISPVTKEPGKINSLNIVITPPWWLSIEAKSIYAIIFILIIWGITKSILRKREIQRQIALSEERLKLSLWGSGDEMWDWDIETGNIFRSNIWGALEFPRDGHRSGNSDEESNIHPMDQERVREALNKHFYGETDHFEAAYRVKGKDDSWIWILDRAKIVERDDKDNALRMTGTIKNISQFKQKEEQLKLFEKAIENISEGMFILDSEYRFVEVNEACCRISQRNRTDFIGNLLTFDLYPESFSNQIRTMLKQQGRWASEVEASRGDKSHFHMELTIDAIYDELGELSHYVGVFSDISRRKQQEEELRKLTNNDLLTGLPNRSNLQVTLGNLVNKEIPHALMVLDLDNFKRINDSLGHQIGDQLLKLVSVRIKSILPKNTSIYRLGGDEFAIVLDKTSDISACAAIAGRVIEAFKTMFEIGNEQLVLGVSIGIVFYPEDEQSEQALLRKADIAMYHAKSAGGNCYQFYSESLNQHAIKQLEIENLIREGLKEDLFEVYYQPKVDLKSGHVAGMEALVRLNHPTRGLIPPNDFIPLAEENGLIIEIGEIVLRKACFAAQKWREQGLFKGRVAVNLSSRQFALPDLQQRIESILRLTQLPASHLELEITEGTVIKQPEMAITVMQQLAKMGVSLALDDFGTGYSSLSYLKRFPIHTLKIDKAFVDDIDKSDRDLKMVDSIITIAHNMGLSVVGEGVEQAAQLNILRALNCEEIQGYIFSKAINEIEFTQLLQDDRSKFMPHHKII